MLTRVYVNNFKCMVNFERKLSALNLLLGANGSGKSTLFEALMNSPLTVSSKKKVTVPHRSSTLRSRSALQGYRQTHHSHYILPAMS